MSRQSVDAMLTAVASELACLGHGPVEDNTLKRLLALADAIHEIRRTIAATPHYFANPTTTRLRRHY